jgi:predicted Na+-dependent transporter
MWLLWLSTVLLGVLAPAGAVDNATRSSAVADDPVEMLLVVITVVTYFYLSVVMFGVGASVKLEDVLSVFRDQKAVFAVGLASQYLVVPAICRFVADVLLKLPNRDVFVIVLIGCCPGGTISNAMAYFARGNIALSVAMTAVSNTLAFGTLPLLLMVWTTGLAQRTTIPFRQIFYSLSMVLVPACLGIWLRVRSAKWARRAERVGAIGGGLLIAAAIVTGLTSNVGNFGDEELLPWKSAVAVAIVAPCGMLFALIATKALHLCQRHRSGKAHKLQTRAVQLPVVATIVLETGERTLVTPRESLVISSSSDRCLSYALPGCTPHRGPEHDTCAGHRHPQLQRQSAG